MIATFRREENPTEGAKGASDETCTLDSDLGGARNVPSAAIPGARTESPERDWACTGRTGLDE